MSAGFEPQRPPERPKGLSFLASAVLLISAALVLTLVAVGVGISSQALAASETANAAAEKEAARKADALDRAVKAADKAAKEKEIADAAAAAQLEVDEYWETRKYYQSTDVLYWKYASYDSYECAGLSCVGIQLVTLEACPKGFFLKAALLKDGKTVGAAERKTPALKANQIALTLLEDRKGTADLFRLDFIYCRN